MQPPNTVRICEHPLCDRPVGDPAFALSRREREAREYGFCVAEHPVVWSDGIFTETSGYSLRWPDAQD